MPLTVATDDPTARRIWPITAMLFTVAVVVMLVNGYGAAIQSTAFFGVTPSRDDYISAGMACLTTLPVFAALIWCGWQRGSRAGLVLIAGPGAVMVVVGLHLLGMVGASKDPEPGRAPRLADLFGDLTLLNWGAVVVLVAIAATTHLLRLRTRRTKKAFVA